MAEWGGGEVTVDLADYYNKEAIDNLLKNKANTNHAHPISSIVDLQSTLDSKSIQTIAIQNMPQKPMLPTKLLKHS